MLFFLGFLISATAACAWPAAPGIYGAVPPPPPPPPGPGSCIYDAAGLEDGCDAAPAGRVLDTALFTTMRQSGQAQYFSAPGVQSDHPAIFNVAGLDYGVGNVGVKCGGTCKIPGTDSLPSGATLDNTNHYVVVNVSGGDVTLSGWDLTGWTVSITGSAVGTLHYWNNYWEESAFTNTQAAINGSGIVREGASSCTNIDVLSSEFKRDFASYPVSTWQYYIYNAGTGSCKPTTTVKYSYFLSVPQHGIRQDSSGAATIFWNVLRGYGQCSDGNGGLTNPSSCAHGNLYVGLQNQLTVDTQDVSFNTIWTDNQSMSGTALIAWFLVRLAGGPIHYTMLRANYNILVANTNSHYTSVIGTASYPVRYIPQLTGVNAVVDASEMKGNLVDCTGTNNVAIQGTSNVSGVLVATGNILLNNGQAIVAPPDTFVPTGANGCKRF